MVGSPAVVFGGLGPGMDMIAGIFGGEGGPPKGELLAEFQTWQNAQIFICDGAIKDVEFEKRIKELFLEYGVLDIDYWIAMESLQQELLRLNVHDRGGGVPAGREGPGRGLHPASVPGSGASRPQGQVHGAGPGTGTMWPLNYVFQAGRALEYEANRPLE